MLQSYHKLSFIVISVEGLEAVPWDRSHMHFPDPAGIDKAAARTESFL